MAENEFLAKGAREGRFTPARIVDAGPPPPGKPVMTFEEAMEDLRQSREDR